jgi:cytochrome c-type biogenesis protein CcmH
MKAKYFLMVAVLFIAAFLLIQPVAGQEPTPSDDEVNAIAKQLYCPVCDNIPLDVCPTQACIQWRNVIREKLSLGWSQAQIKQYFVDQYGERVLATPPARGLNWLVYVLPPIGFLAGVFILLRAFRSWTKESVGETGEKEGTPVDLDDPYVAQLEEELRRRQ